jgi:hypothetical protein
MSLVTPKPVRAPVVFHEPRSVPSEDQDSQGRGYVGVSASIFISNGTTSLNSMLFGTIEDYHVLYQHPLMF